MAGLGFHIQVLAGACHRHGVGGLCGVFVPLGGACPPSGARSRRRPLECAIHHNSLLRHGGIKSRHPGAGVRFMARLLKERRGRFFLSRFFAPLGEACPPSGARSGRRPHGRPQKGLKNHHHHQALRRQHQVFYVKSAQSKYRCKAS